MIVGRARLRRSERAAMAWGWSLMTAPAPLFLAVLATRWAQQRAISDTSAAWERNVILGPFCWGPTPKWDLPFCLLSWALQLAYIVGVLIWSLGLLRRSLQISGRGDLLTIRGWMVLIALFAAFVASLRGPEFLAGPIVLRLAPPVFLLGLLWALRRHRRLDRAGRFVRARRVGLAATLVLAAIVAWAVTQPLYDLLGLGILFLWPTIASLGVVEWARLRRGLRAAR